MQQPEHSKIIDQAAKQILKPSGLERKGKSRTWLDDNGWYTTVVEFQPDRGGRGTYLNAGVNFHWYLKDYLSFDIGYRETGFIKFITTEQFTPEAEKLARLALDKVLFYRHSLRNIDAANSTILSHDFTSENLWGSYHKGVACGLTANLTGLNTYFERLLQLEDHAPFVGELKNRTKGLRNIASDTDKFRQHIKDIIIATRKVKKLKELQIEIK